MIQRDKYASFLKICQCFLNPEIPFTTIPGLPVHHVATTCSVSGGKLFQRYVQPSYLPGDAGLNLLLTASIAAAVTALISGSNGFNQRILNFLLHLFVFDICGISFPVVARNYSKLNILFTSLFVYRVTW